MQRLLSILKYTPLALWVVLLICWPLSLVIGFGASAEPNFQGTAIWIQDADLYLWLESEPQQQLIPTRLLCFVHGYFVNWEQTLGSLAINSPLSLGDGVSFSHFPIPLALTCLLPPAAGPLIKYRFPLWSWFAWIALIAAEFAFYVR